MTVFRPLPVISTAFLRPLVAFRSTFRWLIFCFRNIYRYIFVRVFCVRLQHSITFLSKRQLKEVTFDMQTSSWLANVGEENVLRWNISPEPWFMRRFWFTTPIKPIHVDIRPNCNPFAVALIRIVHKRSDSNENGPEVRFHYHAARCFRRVLSLILYIRIRDDGVDLDVNVRTEIKSGG